MVSYFENIKIKNNDPLNLPETILMRPSLICIFDRLKDEFILITPVRAKRYFCTRCLGEWKKYFIKCLMSLMLVLNIDSSVQKDTMLDNNAPSNLKDRFL